MMKFFMDTEETIERWKYAAGFVGVALAWGIVLAANFGII